MGAIKETWSRLRRFLPYVNLFIGASLIAIGYVGQRNSRRAAELAEQAQARVPAPAPAILEAPEGLPGEEENDQAGSFPERILTMTDTHPLAKELAESQEVVVAQKENEALNQLTEANLGKNFAAPAVDSGAPAVGAPPASAMTVASGVKDASATWDGSLAAPEAKPKKKLNSDASGWNAALKLGSSPKPTAIESAAPERGGGLRGGAGMSGGIAKPFKKKIDSKASLSPTK